MFREEKEEINFVSNTRRKKFIEGVNKALNEDNSLSKKQFNEVKKLFE